MSIVDTALNRARRRTVAAIGLLACLLAVGAARAEVAWPAGQAMPSFSAPASTQDLIVLRAGSGALRWQAEGPRIGHGTGRVETDGWLCQTGIDKPNDFIAFGPYERGLPTGANVARFRLKTDNNTADDQPVVTLDVRDNANGQLLASRTVTRRQFPVAGDYTELTLPFNLSGSNAANAQIETRVFWHGGAYLKLDWVGVDRAGGDDELAVFASLKGLVNARQPRIFSYEGDDLAEGRTTWLQSLGLNWNEVADPWQLLVKYRGEIGGLIVYDDAVPDTINLATTLAAGRRALIASPRLLQRLSSAPYNLPVLLDLRGRYNSKLAVYQSLFDEHWPRLSKRLIVGLGPDIKASVREYAAALGVATVWLDPQVPAEAALLGRFLSSLESGAVYAGWWPSEGEGISFASRYGVATVPSDFSTNLTVHGGMPRSIKPRPIPAKPPLQNRIYVAFILSDGDNLQYVEHLMRKLWANPARGQVPIGWTVSPAMVDAMPGALNYYWSSATANDVLISGPSGLGYTYPNEWTDRARLDRYVARTDEYLRRAGLRVVTVWNTITGGINANAGASYAANAPSVLGLTAQNTGGGLTIHGNRLPAMALSCNYCTGEPAMRDHIARAAQGWNRNEPRFVIIQAQPWTDVRPDTFANVARSLGGDYAVVRPDHLFQLLRERNGLPIDPLNTNNPPPTSGPIVIEAENYFAMSGVQTEATTDAGGGRNVGWIDAGDWMAWQNISLPAAGAYRVEYRVASISGGRLSLDLNAGSVQLGEVNVPATGAWQSWTIVSHVVQLPAGPFNLGVNARRGGWNLNWVRISTP